MENKATDLLTQESRLTYSFWESPTLEELANAQNARPLTDVRALFGTWPGDVNDNFETDIHKLRHQSTVGNILK